MHNVSCLAPAPRSVVLVWVGEFCKRAPGASEYFKVSKQAMNVLKSQHASMSVQWRHLCDCMQSVRFLQARSKTLMAVTHLMP